MPGSGPPQWPALPVAGELVQIPLPLPDMLLSAVGYDGGARYVALRWSGGSGGDVLWTDGAMTTTGWWPPWRLLIREHVLGRAMFASYDLGDLHEDPGAPAPHWLLADRWEHTLHVGLARDVQQFLATQPSTTSAVADAVGPERLLELLQQQMQAMPVPSPDVVRAAIARRAADHQALQRWLDDALAQINPAPA
ncbi:MAG TPA: hypothetical protein VGO80_06380 [Solirubrobacteraceae bacterium]|jgi:hypothetical protein|nr:hypothetical protein [Solirubrobacteraceae bacterium]